MPRLPVLRDGPPAFPGERAGPRGLCELIAGTDHLDRVVRAGMETARVSLDVMTADFKAMLVPPAGPARFGSRRDAPSVIALFKRLARRGVEVRVLHAGVPSSAALDELRGGLPPGLAVRRCPRLHAKAVVVDADRMYLGSANLTGAGLGAKGPTRRNFELGVWTDSPALIDATLDAFNALWEGRECAACGRRDVCPVPLEEPDL